MGAGRVGAWGGCGAVYGAGVGRVWGAGVLAWRAALPQITLYIQGDSYGSSYQKRLCVGLVNGSAGLCALWAGGMWAGKGGCVCVSLLLRGTRWKEV